uniref:Uncharacterized protein n=1 Tax=Cannabis sativa TaxID=3483 RepID=A0A803PCK5_CANSA
MENVEEADDVGMVDGGQEIELAVEAAAHVWSIEVGEVDKLHRRLVSIDDVLRLPYCGEGGLSHLRFQNILSIFILFASISL